MCLLQKKLWVLRVLNKNNHLQVETQNKQHLIKVKTELLQVSQILASIRV